MTVYLARSIHFPAGSDVRIGPGAGDFRTRVNAIDATFRERGSEDCGRIEIDEERRFFTIRGKRIHPEHGYPVLVKGSLDQAVFWEPMTDEEIAKAYPEPKGEVPEAEATPIPPVRRRGRPPKLLVPSDPASEPLEAS